MFARAGVTARVMRTNRSYSFAQPVKAAPQVKSKKRKKRDRFRLFIPFMWSTCVWSLVGLGVLVGGCAMCVVGYYADHFASRTANNSTYTYSLREPVAYFHLRNMTYVGPVLMGIGCFIVVVACVVVCETRDKMLRVMAEEEIKQGVTKKKPDIYDLIIDKIKMQTTPRSVKSADSDSNHQGSCFSLGSRSSQPRGTNLSPEGTIGRALVSIPMDIFSVEVETARYEDRSSQSQPPGSPDSHSCGLLSLDSPGSTRRGPTLNDTRLRLLATRLTPPGFPTPLYLENGAETDSLDRISTGHSSSVDSHSKITTIHFNSHVDLTSDEEGGLNSPSTKSISSTTQDVQVSLGLKQRIMNRKDIPSPKKQHEPAGKYPIAIVVHRASVHDNADVVVNERPRTAPEFGVSIRQADVEVTQQVAPQSRVKSPTLSSSSSSLPSSPFRPAVKTLSIRSISSDDDSLELTEEMLRYFDKPR